MMTGHIHFKKSKNFLLTNLCDVKKVIKCINTFIKG